MPQASQEQRDEWGGPSEETAISYLEARGYELGGDFYWTPPPEHTPTEKEWSAMEFLMAEWDFGLIK